jgi:hypothetical protein
MAYYSADMLAELTAGAMAHQMVVQRAAEWALTMDDLLGLQKEC